MITKEKSDYLKAYRTEHKQRISLQKKVWYQEHREQELLKRKAHYLDNKEAYIGRAGKWAKSNPEKMSVCRKNWRLNNMERMNLHGTNYRARKAGAISEPYNRLLVYERDGGVCGICHKRVLKIYKHPDSRSFTIDHIYPISLGGNDVLGNIQTAHLGCNSRKRDRI